MSEPDPTTAEQADSPPAPASPLGDEPLYVGYLPMPAAHKRAVKRVVVVLALAVLAVAGIIAHFQRAPAPEQAYRGSGKNVQELTGILYTEPYGVLRVWRERPEDGARTLLLTTGGKSGVAHLVAGKSGLAVQMKGSLRGRDGRYVYAMDTGYGIHKAKLSAAARTVLERPPATPVSAGEVALRGEIIDPKCFTGAMKPGDGKAHKACAINCLRGGIPPVFATRDQQGRATYYLLTDATGGSVLEPLIPFVGDPVQLRGQVLQQDDMLLLRLTPGSIERL